MEALPSGGGTIAMPMVPAMIAALRTATARAGTAMIVTTTTIAATGATTTEA